MRSIVCALMFSFTVNAVSSDWPRWLGPNANNTVAAEANFNPDLNVWKILWKAELGKGYSAVAVSGERAYSLGHDGTANETVYCLNAETGAEIWKKSYPAKLMPDLHTGGPNATPTIVGDKVITISKDGQAFCFSADKGEIVWKANLLEILGTKVPRWGFASSAVIDGTQIVLCSGKALALDLATGKPLWTSQTHYFPQGYSTAPVFEINGAKFTVALDGKGCNVYSAKDGAEIARHPFKALFDMNATTPAILDGGKRIFISNTVQSEMLSFDGKTLSPIWTSKELRNTMNQSVIESGAIYGVSGEQENDADALVSLNEADGKENWSQPNIGFGNTIGIGQTLLVLTERGLLLTVKADPAKYTEISRRQVLEKVCWTPPTYAHGHIFMRNDKGNLVVLAP